MSNNHSGKSIESDPIDFQGGKGDDLIRGGRDDDQLLGGEGNDVLDGGLGVAANDREWRVAV